MRICPVEPRDERTWLVLKDPVKGGLVGRVTERETRMETEISALAPRLGLDEDGAQAILDAAVEEITTNFL